MRILNVEQSEAASRSTRVSKHEVGVYDHGGHAPRRYLRGPGGEYLLLKDPICVYLMWSSPRPHPTLLVSPSTKWTYMITVDMSPEGISEVPGVNIAYWRTEFAYT